jgi:spore germination cell wall hydrolase CwlJ-like protein
MRSLARSSRIAFTVWRSRLVMYWHLEARKRLSGIALATIPIVLVGSIVCFAYLKGSEEQLAPEQLQATQREARRALRRESDLECLAENVYFEARGEPIEGQYAVAEVTLNRTRAEHFPHTVCAVVHEMRWDPARRRPIADFSWTQSGGLSPEDGPAWKRAMTVANAAYDDLHDPVVPGALFYHATSVRPGWARGRTTVATIGNHIFYR